MKLTAVGAEGPLSVIIVARCGGAPTVPVPTSLSRARVVGIFQKGEGEDAWGTVGVSSVREENCKCQNRLTLGHTSPSSAHHSLGVQACSVAAAAVFQV